MTISRLLSNISTDKGLQQLNFELLFMLSAGANTKENIGDNDEEDQCNHCSPAVGKCIHIKR